MLDSNLDTAHSILILRPQSALSAEDFARVGKAVDPFIEQTGGLAGIVIEARAFPGWEGLGAMAAHLRFVRDHHKQVKKVAVVTDSKLGTLAEKLGAHFVAAEIRHFPAGQMEAAKTWIAGAKNTICLWYDRDAEDAARFYAKTFPDSSVGAVMRAPGDFPSGKQGDVLTVEFTVMGIPCLGLNGGPMFKHSEAFSFQVATADQAETDRYWNAIVGNGGEESACGWCKDKWGLSWQITPIALTRAITDPDRAVAKRAFDAMMTMTKIDVAAIEAARRG